MFRYDLMYHFHTSLTCFDDFRETMALNLPTKNKGQQSTTPHSDPHDHDAKPSPSDEVPVDDDPANGSTPNPQQQQHICKWCQKTFESENEYNVAILSVASVSVSQIRHKVVSDRLRSCSLN